MITVRSQPVAAFDVGRASPKSINDAGHDVQLLVLFDPPQQVAAVQTRQIQVEQDERRQGVVGSVGNNLPGRLDAVGDDQAVFNPRASDRPAGKLDVFGGLSSTSNTVGEFRFDMGFALAKGKEKRCSAAGLRLEPDATAGALHDSAPAPKPAPEPSYFLRLCRRRNMANTVS